MTGVVLPVYLPTECRRLLLGCIYGLVAMGLSLIYGVMGIVNFAHGAFVMVAMYASFWLNRFLGIDPILSSPLIALLMFLLWGNSLPRIDRQSPGGAFP